MIFLSKCTAKCIFEIAGVQDILYLLGTPVIKNLDLKIETEEFFFINQNTRKDLQYPYGNFKFNSFIYY